MSSSLGVTVPSPTATVGVISLLYSVSPLCLCAGFTCVGQGRRCVGGSRCAPNELSFTFLTCPLADDGCCVIIWWRFNRHSTLHLLSIRDDVSTYTLLFTHSIVPWWRFNVLTNTQFFACSLILTTFQPTLNSSPALQSSNDVSTGTHLFACSLILMTFQPTLYTYNTIQLYCRVLIQLH